MQYGGMRVQAIREGESFEKHSYAVSNPETAPLQILAEEDDDLIISCMDFHLRVQKFPLRLSFEKHDETVINSDEAAFGIAWDGEEVCNYKALAEDEIFTGMGEKTGPLNKRGRQYVHWNTDEFGYHQETDPLYASTPFYMARNGDNWYGIFLDNTSRTSFNFGASNHRFSFFRAERGQLDYYFFHAETPGDILMQYCNLTGFTPLPPKWSLGYQQCRYSYYPASELMSLAQNFRDREIPADVLYLDIHYMDAYKVFTWHPERFKNIRESLQLLKDQGFRVVIIVDPGIKLEDGYTVMEDGLSKDVFLKYPDGDQYIGEAWPGKIYFPDFTRPETREWWAEYFEDLVEDGVSGFWNDMNEPAVWGKNVPDLVEFEYDGEKVNHKLGHNVYGMQMARSTFEGARQAQKGSRPFVLTRSAFSGIQRYAAVWTGDNVSNEEHLFLGTRMIVQMGLAGVPFCGNDIGGFIGESNIELYRRWIAVGAFSPFFRGHTMINSRDAEPWSFGEEAEEIARNYITLRYRLMPYIYSSFYEHTQNGMPLVRALMLHDPLDKTAFDPQYQNQFMFGASVLVCPAGPYEKLVKVYLPEGLWYDLFTDEAFEGGAEYILECENDTIPVFVRAGAILTMQSAVQHTAESHEGILELHIYAGDDGVFTHYEDDGESYNYEKGAFLERELSFNSENGSLNIDKCEGSYASDFNTIRLYLHGWEDLESVEMNGETLAIMEEDYYFVKPISNFDPYINSIDDSKVVKHLKYVELPHRSDEIRLSFS